MKKFLNIVIFFLFVAIATYIYARFVEPNMLNVHYEKISSIFLNEQCSNLKILQFSDTHISDYFNIDDLEETVIKINEENPDIVVFTGDLIDQFDSYKGDVDKIVSILGKIEASLGKYAIYGNHDYGGGAQEAYSRIMKSAGFVTLVNENTKIDEYNLNIVGLDDSIFGKIDKDRVENFIDENYYNILISHEPDVVDAFLEYDIDLFLSGHSHGGQVNIPFFSSKILPALGEKYVRGSYKFENSRNTFLYVNIGIGTSQVPFRFMAVPELSVFTLNCE